MWQRIQTLFLALAVLINISIFFLNIAEFDMMGILMEFNIYGIVTAEDIENPHVIFWLAIIASLSILLSLGTIFSFKKRQLQLKIAQLNLLMQIGFIVGIFYAIERAMNYVDLMNDGGEPEYKLGAYLSLLPLILIFLAIRNIKQDESLVRAADRIR